MSMKARQTRRHRKAFARISDRCFEHTRQRQAAVALMRL